MTGVFLRVVGNILFNFSGVEFYLGHVSRTNLRVQFLVYMEHPLDFREYHHFLPEKSFIPSAVSSA